MKHNGILWRLGRSYFMNLNVVSLIYWIMWMAELYPWMHHSHLSSFVRELFLSCSHPQAIKWSLEKCVSTSLCAKYLYVFNGQKEHHLDWTKVTASNNGPFHSMTSRHYIDMIFIHYAMHLYISTLCSLLVILSLISCRH